MLLDQMAINGMASSSSSPFFPPNFLLQIQNPHVDQEHHHHHHQTPNHFSLLSNSQQEFRGYNEIRRAHTSSTEVAPPPLVARMTSTSLPDLDGHRQARRQSRRRKPVLGKRSMSTLISGAVVEPCEEMNGGEDDLSDDCSGDGAGEKKRRLNIEQVRTLEKNFEIGNKLEPERKMHLARALGLQPRQVAIWFQNRRARWKTKQLEKDYNVLKKQFEALKSQNQEIKSHNKKLQSEISSLKGIETSELINLNKETEGSCSNRSENSSEINLDVSRPAANESPLNRRQSIPFFPTVRPPTMVQLLQGSSECPKIEHNSVPDENFSNLLCNMDEQTAFWPWSDPHSFH